MVDLLVSDNLVEESNCCNGFGTAVNGLAHLLNALTVGGHGVRQFAFTLRSSVFLVANRVPSDTRKLFVIDKHRHRTRGCRNCYNPPNILFSGKNHFQRGNKFVVKFL